MKQRSKDLFSKFISWLTSVDDKLPEIYKEKGGQDLFSKLMNRISN